MKVIQSIIQYLLPLVIAVFLFRYAYKGVDFHTLWIQLAQVKPSWIFASIGLSLASHLVRAYRWKLLLASLDFRVSLVQAFVALMIGYLSNVLLPRLGEVVRCTVLKKHTHIPTSLSLGTVVGERAIDLVSLLFVLGLSLALTFEQLQAMLHDTLLTHISPNFLPILGWSSLGLFIIISLLFILIKHTKIVAQKDWLLKVQAFFQGIWEGINSINLSQQKITLLVLSVLMWLLYYLAGYAGVFAINETSSLSLSAGLAILAMSSLSLTLPIQGGIGAYHLLVSSTLIAYGITKDHAMLYVTAMHTAQLIMTFLGGAISLIVSWFLPKNKALATT